MQVADTKKGDVLLDQHGKVWQRTGDRLWNWSTFSGPVSYYGEWKPSYGPQGELCLLVRDGQPVTHRSYLRPDADTVAQAEEQ
jgi:hypothetical protein